MPPLLAKRPVQIDRLIEAFGFFETFDPDETGAFEIGSREHGARDVCAGEIGARQIRVGEIGAGQIRACKFREPHNRALHVRAAQARSREIAILENILIRRRHRAFTGASLERKEIRFR